MNLLVITPTLGKSPYLYSSLATIRGARLPMTHLIIHPSDVNLGMNLLPSESTMVEHATTKGLYDAINQAVDSVGEWTHLTYINDDDNLGADFNRLWTEYVHVSPDAFGYGKVSLINDNSARMSSVPIESDSHWFEALLAQGISPLNQQGMIIPRALWQKLGGFRTEYKLCADLDFWLRAHRMGWPFKYYPMEVGQFRIREGQLSGDTQKLEAEIAAVVARDAPRKIGSLEKFYARWQFRIKNFPIYASRFIHGRRVRGMKMLAGK